MEAKLGLIIDESKPQFQKMDSENGNERKKALIEESSHVENESKRSELTDEDFFNNVGDEEKKFYEESGYNPDDIENMNIQCTACWKQVNHRITNAIVRHPMLGVPICRTCNNFYGEEEDEWTKDDEGFDCFCRWCGNGGDLICCDKCTKSFCKRCIQRNKGRSKVAEISASSKWECFSCSPSQIYDIRALCYAIFKWSSSFTMKEQEKSSKKRMDKLKKAREDRMLKIKEAEEPNKIENFIDENINEAFDTLEIYQKCLETEKKKWLKSRKSMNANNAAVTARNLRRIYAITRQNMELLDTALVQAYGGLYPEEDENKLKYGKIPGDNKIPQADISLNKTPRSTSKKRKLSAMLNSTDVDENEERQIASKNPVEISSTASAPESNGSGHKTINKPKESSGSGHKAINKPKGKIKISTNLFRKSPPTTQKKKKRKPLLSDGDHVQEVNLEISDESDSEMKTKSQANSGRKKRKSSEFDVSFTFE